MTPFVASKQSSALATRPVTVAGEQPSPSSVMTVADGSLDPGESEGLKAESPCRDISTCVPTQMCGSCTTSARNRQPPAAATGSALDLIKCVRVVVRAGMELSDSAPHVSNGQDGSA